MSGLVVAALISIGYAIVLVLALSLMTVGKRADRRERETHQIAPTTHPKPRARVS
jgi:hypothetical protein